MLFFFSASASAMSFSSTLTKLFKSSWMSLSLYCSPAYWSAPGCAPAVDPGVASPLPDEPALVMPGFVVFEPKSDDPPLTAFFLIGSKLLPFCEAFVVV